MHVTFDAQSLYIPDVYSKTAKFLGAPLVPPFRIRIEPVKLEVMLTCPAIATAVAALQGFLSAANRANAHLQGVINKATGEAQLQFIANFMFSASKLYKVNGPSICIIARQLAQYTNCVYLWSTAYDKWVSQIDILVVMQAPPLYVVTNLTTEGVQGSRRSGQGKRMDPNGFTKCVAAFRFAVMVCAACAGCI